MQEISLQLRRELGERRERHLYLLLKGEDFGPCPACCINSEGKESLSHCILESCSVTSWLCGTRQENCFRISESSEGWKTGLWWKNSCVELLLAGKLPKKGIPTHQCLLWLLLPHSVSSLSVLSLFPKVIRHLVPLKIRLSILLRSPSHWVKHLMLALH